MRGAGSGSPSDRRPRSAVQEASAVSAVRCCCAGRRIVAYTVTPDGGSHSTWTTAGSAGVDGGVSGTGRLCCPCSSVPPHDGLPARLRVFGPAMSSLPSGSRGAAVATEGAASSSCATSSTGCGGTDATEREGSNTCCCGNRYMLLSAPSPDGSSCRWERVWPGSLEGSGLEESPMLRRGADEPVLGVRVKPSTRRCLGLGPTGEVGRKSRGCSSRSGGRGRSGADDNVVFK